MDGLFSLLHRIPNVIWSGVIASILTFFGVLYSDRSNTRRLRIQLKHDGDEKARERVATLRRDVFLSAAEELNKVNSYLGSLTQMDIVKANIGDGLQGFYTAAAKLQLVAEPKTALLANQLVVSYTELFLRIMPNLGRIQEARTEVELNGVFYDKAQVQVDRILAQMAHLNESAQMTQPVFMALQQAFVNNQKQTVDYAEARSVAWEKLNRLSADFIRQLLSEFTLILESQIPLLIEIRRDLGLTTELGVFREQLKEGYKKLSTQMEITLRTLQEDK